MDVSINYNHFSLLQVRKVQRRLRSEALSLQIFHFYLSQATLNRLLFQVLRSLSSESVDLRESKLAEAGLAYRRQVETVLTV